jgi:hypothetical protein
MPTRLIRDEMLESEAVLSLPVEARWFYVSILLSADDVGLFEATTFKLTRRADIRRDHGERYMEMLVDADLVRLYLVDGKRFGFIPKFRQRLQIKRLRYPPPPPELMRDDEDALNKINNLTRDPTVGQPLDNGCATVAQPSEPEPEPEPKPKSQKERRERTPAVGKPTDVEPEVWQSWLVIRKAKRLPLTDLAMLAISVWSASMSSSSLSVLDNSTSILSRRSRVSFSNTDTLDAAASSLRFRAALSPRSLSSTSCSACASCRRSRSILSISRRC